MEFTDLIKNINKKTTPEGVDNEGKHIFKIKRETTASFLFLFSI